MGVKYGVKTMLGEALCLGSIGRRNLPKAVPHTLGPETLQAACAVAKVDPKTQTPTSRVSLHLTVKTNLLPLIMLIGFSSLLPPCSYRAIITLL